MSKRRGCIWFPSTNSSHTRSKFASRPPTLSSFLAPPSSSLLAMFDRSEGDWKSTSPLHNALRIEDGELFAELKDCFAAASFAAACEPLRTACIFDKISLNESGGGSNGIFGAVVLDNGDGGEGVIKGANSGGSAAQRKEDGNGCAWQASAARSAT